MKPFPSSFALLCGQVLIPFVIWAQDPIAVIPNIVDSLILVSRTHTADAEFDAAFAASAIAGERARACCGEHSVAYAAYCFNEGRIRYFMGKNQEAIPWYLRSRELRAELLGTHDPEYGKSLNNLAIVYDVMGRYEQAEPLYLEALGIREATAGRESETYANALANLSGLYLQMGDFEAAEINGLQAKDIRERLLGENHPRFAESLVNLANLYYETNNFARAKQLFLQAKNIIENQDEIDAYLYLNVLDNLGALFQQLDDFELAEQYYEEVAELRSDIWGADHADYALSLNHLAVIYEYTNRLAAAERNLLQALGILEEIGQKDGLDYGFYLQNLGDVYHKQDQDSIARDIHLRALDILVSNLSKNHPRYLRGLRAIVDIEQELGNYEAATHALRELGALEERSLASAVRHLSEEELANYTQDFKINLYRYFLLAEQEAALADLCYDKIMVYKGFLQNAALQLNQLAQTDSLTTATYKQLRLLHRRLAVQYSSSSEEQEGLEALELEANTLEKELVRSAATFGNALQQVGWKEVQQELGPEEAAIEFVHYQSDPEDGDKPIIYAALLLLPSEEQPLFIPLCNNLPLDTLLDNENQTVDAFINTLYEAGGKGAKLYQLIWAPIVKKLEGFSNIERIYYSASGLLHRINVEAIPTPAGRRLAQNYQLLALSSTRQLVVKKANPALTDAAPQAVLFGGINYGSLEEEIPPTSGGTAGTRAIQSTNYQKHRGYQPDQGYWQPLPWTEVEVLTAGELLMQSKYVPTLMTKEAASEAALKALGESGPPPGVLHLATHGFFFPDPQEMEGAQELAFRASERSMIRSGLVLADGNYAWANGRPREAGDEDGILTAYEVSKMNLQETELVVLSACETGLGDIKGTEGVYGLQRAFKIAGARYLIMTLWQVPDYQTQAFMTTFYLAWLEEGKTIPEAFRAAQAYMRARYQSPFQWAGFVLLE